MIGTGLNSVQNTNIDTTNAYEKDIYLIL